VPLTLSVVRSLVVEVGGEAYAFPLAHIERTLDVPAEDRADRRAPAFLARRPAYRPGRRQPVAQRPAAQDAASLRVVVIREREQLYGVAVERLIGERVLVVMPLDPRLGKVRTFPPAPCSTMARWC
jgi:two-component system sensor histidine kinase and response regulator WspE